MGEWILGLDWVGWGGVVMGVERILDGGEGGLEMGWVWKRMVGNGYW